VTGPVQLQHLPTEVVAYEYDGTNAADIIRWANPDDGSVVNVYETLAGELVVVTLDGHHVADVGQWVVRGTQGEWYPITPKVKNACYELVGEWSPWPPAT
jgi:hypothetical protein